MSTVLLVLLASMLLPSAAGKLKCFVGHGSPDELIVMENFQLCSITWNSATNSLYYGGETKITDTPLKGMFQFKIGNCVLNVKRRGPALLECLCNEDHCNEYVSLRAFQRIINRQHQISQERRVS